MAYGGTVNPLSFGIWQQFPRASIPRDKCPLETMKTGDSDRVLVHYELHRCTGSMNL